MKNDFLMVKDNRKRLFEMMGRVAGMSLNEVGTLPPGFKDSDITTLEDFVNSPCLSEDKTGVQMQPADLRQIIDKRKSGAARDREDPYIHNKTIEIVDKDGKAINRDWLANQLKQRPPTLLGTNEKVGKTGVLKISLPSYKGLYYDEFDEDFKVVDTCPNAGDCKAFCYQQKGRSVMYDTAVISKTRILNFLLNHWEDFRYKLIDEIEVAKLSNEKKGIKTIVRWHDSGDFLSEKYLALAMEIARRTPDVLHYAYTKMVSFAKGADVPENFIFRFSIDPSSPETHLIDKLKDKYADVIPKFMFRDLTHTRTITTKSGNKNIWYFNSPEALRELKLRMSKFYDVDLNTILSFHEMSEIPEEGINKWSVIVMPSDADTAAHRNDVHGVYLLIH